MAVSTDIGHLAWVGVARQNYYRQQALISNGHAKARASVPGAVEKFKKNLERMPEGF